MRSLIVFLFFAFVFVPFPAMAQEELVDFGSASSVITWLMPVIVLGATWLIKKIAPFITGTVTLIVVPLVSTGIAWLGTVLDSDSSFLVSLLAGLGSVFLNQFYRHLTGSN